MGVSFGIYNGFAALVAFLLPVIAGYTNRKTTHAISLTIGAIESGLHLLYVQSYDDSGGHGWCRSGLGQYTFHALCHSGGVPAQ